MKILHVIDSGGFYGAEAMLVELAVEQIKSGHSVTVCSIGTPGEPEKPVEKVCKERGVNVYPLRMKAGLNLFGGMNIVNYAKQNRFDLFHSHGYKGNILLGILPKFIRSIPLVTTLHGWTSTKKLSKIWMYEILDSMLLGRMDSIALVSDAMTNRKGIANRKFRLIKIIPNGIGENKLDISSTDAIASKLLKMKEKGPVIGSIGRLSFEKGYDILLEAFVEVRKQMKEAKLVILGDGKLMDELKSRSSELGLDDNVWFAGYVEGANKYIKFFDVYVNSSRTEGTPITLLEAMRSQTPIVAARVGGNADLIEAGNCGLVFESGDINTLTQQICQVANDATLRNKMVKIASTKFIENYSSNTMMLRYDQLYKELI